MSQKYRVGDKIPGEVLTTRLRELAHAVTSGPDAVQTEFTMRVPAELDRDADLVLLEAAKRIYELEQRCQNLADTLARHEKADRDMNIALNTGDGCYRP